MSENLFGGWTRRRSSRALAGREAKTMLKLIERVCSRKACRIGWRIIWLQIPRLRNLLLKMKNDGGVCGMGKGSG